MGERSGEIWYPNLKRKTYRVVGVESQRLTLRGLDSGEVLIVLNEGSELRTTTSRITSVCESCGASDRA